jgi:CheY-like chemotaxis protein
VTNAVKYGALSVPEGRVSLSWQLEPEALSMKWIETDGPPTVPPVRYGFGTKVIGASIERQLHGSVAFDWRAEGLCCTIAIPLSNLDMSSSAAEPGKAADPAEPLRTKMPPAAKRILLVEDEALIAIMMSEALRELGLRVIGPVGTIPLALKSARDEHIDGAILDVNLAGHPIYPVADMLASRGIPFVFVTGYNADGIDRRYAHVPVLEKPIEPEMLQQLFVDGLVNGHAPADGPDDADPAHPTASAGAALPS